MPEDATRTEAGLEAAGAPERIAALEPEASPELTVLVVAPIGRDSRLIQATLEKAGLRARIVPTMDEAVAESQRSPVGGLLVTEEVLTPATIELLRHELTRQPAWSDLPVMILTIGGASTPLSRRREQDRLPLGSVTLMDRPIRMATLISSVRSALRSRARQYQVRDTLRERDLAEASRRESESRLKTAISIAKLGSWELDVTSGHMVASATCRVHFGLPKESELSFGDLLERIHPEDRRSVLRGIAAAIKTGASYAAEYRVLWPDGSVHWNSSSGQLLRAEGVSGSGRDRGATAGLRMAGVTLDITERVLSEMALRKADKLALVGRLSSSIAHEINNPLESVTNLLYLLDGAKLGEAERDYVTLAQQELARISEITAQTLTFNRQQNSFERAVLPKILDSVLALYQGRLSTSGIEVQRRYSFGEPVLCFPGEIRQIFTNLIGNAFDAMRTGGTLLVRECRARHPRTQRPGVRITIADTGTGIPEHVKMRLFEPFQSTKGNNGTGLGLWISKGIAEKHGGALQVRTSSRTGCTGTVFCVFLPLEPTA